MFSRRMLIMKVFFHFFSVMSALRLKENDVKYGELGEAPNSSTLLKDFYSKVNHNVLMHVIHLKFNVREIVFFIY